MFVSEVDFTNVAPVSSTVFDCKYEEEKRNYL